VSRPKPPRPGLSVLDVFAYAASGIAVVIGLLAAVFVGLCLLWLIVNIWGSIFS
jgi:hypothetical protein